MDILVTTTSQLVTTTSQQVITTSQLLVLDHFPRGRRLMKTDLRKEEQPRLDLRERVGELRTQHALPPRTLHLTVRRVGVPGVR